MSSAVRGRYYDDDDVIETPTDRRKDYRAHRPITSVPSVPINNNVFIESESLLELGPGPVKLTPSWEEKNLPNDQLNFKHLTLEDYLSDTKPPSDRCNFVYLILLLHGIATTLMPWNVFITAEQYFVDYKLNTTATMTMTTTTSKVTSFPLHDEYRRHFLSYLGLAAQIPNVLFSWLNLFIQFGGDTTIRIVASIAVEVIIVIGTIVLAMIDSSSWPGIFFWLTMGSVIVLNMANGIYQNSVYGMAARMPMKYSNAVVLGSNMSGTLTAVLMIISITGSANIRTAAIYYFIGVLFLLLACFDTYFALPLLRFYRYHARQTTTIRGRQFGLGIGVQTTHPSNIPYCTIFIKTCRQLFNIFFVFFVTLSVFPVVLVDIQMIDPNFFTTEKYFTPVTCFLFFYVSAMMGNLFSFFIRWPGRSGFGTCLVVIRILFIPYFVFCNYKPENGGRIMPILFYNDWSYCTMTLVLGWTSGYFSSLAIMYTPRCVEKEHARIAGMMAAASLCLGLFCGVAFSRVLPWNHVVNAQFLKTVLSASNSHGISER